MPAGEPTTTPLPSACAMYMPMPASSAHLHAAAAVVPPRLAAPPPLARTAHVRVDYAFGPPYLLHTCVDFMAEFRPPRAHSRQTGYMLARPAIRVRHAAPARQLRTQAHHGLLRALRPARPRARRLLQYLFNVIDVFEKPFLSISTPLWVG